jgi:hypothetical protein
MHDDRALRRTPLALSPERAEYGLIGVLVERFLRNIFSRCRAIGGNPPRYLFRVLRRARVTLRQFGGTGVQGALSAHEGRSPAEIAHRLLAEHLSPQQLREMDFKRGFTVRGGKTGVRYLIRQGRISNVYVLDKHGFVIANMCFGPAAEQNGYSRELPEADVMLAQKIALEDPELEPEALRVAKIRASRHIQP